MKQPRPRRRETAFQIRAKHAKKQVDHNVFATSCELNSPDIASARRSSCPIICSPGLVLIVANAHSVFEMSCELKFPDIASERRSIANRSEPVVLYLCLAIMYRVLAICWDPKSCMFCRADPPVIVMPAPVIGGGYPAALSGLGGKLWPHSWFNSAV